MNAGWRRATPRRRPVFLGLLFVTAAASLLAAEKARVSPGAAPAPRATSASPTGTPAARAAAPIATPEPTATPTATPTLGPRPAPELEALQFLVEERTHEEIYHPGFLDAHGRASARSKAAWILDGHRLYLVYKSRTPAGDFESRGLLGWDPVRRLYTLDWFDNTGAARQYAGDFDPQGNLVLGAEAVVKGENVRESFSIHKADGGKVLFLVERSVGTGPVKLMLESLAGKAPAPTPTPSSSATPAGSPTVEGTTPTPTPTPSPETTPRSTSPAPLATASPQE